MKSIFLFLLIAFFSFALCQDTIFVHRTNTTAKIFELEDELLNLIQDYYNIKNNSNIIFKTIRVPRFYNILEALDEATKNKNYAIAGMSGITITKKRLERYDFSVPYLLVREAIFTRKDHMCNNHKNCWQIKGTKIAFNKKTLQEKRIKILEAKYGIIPYPCNIYQEKVNAIVTGKADFFIGDNITKWNSDEVILVANFSEQIGDGFGIAYPKGSLLKNKFDKYISYISRSSLFIIKIEEIYGKNIGKYYREYIKSYYQKKYYDDNID